MISKLDLYRLRLPNNRDVIEFAISRKFVYFVSILKSRLAKDGRKFVFEGFRSSLSSIDAYFILESLKTKAEEIQMLAGFVHSNF